MEITSSRSGPSLSSRKRNKKGSVCTHCRQLKFKCDAIESFPDPCSRCRKAGRRCEVDPSFKRVANKERLDSLEKELRQMRQELRSRRMTPSSDSHPGADNISSEGNPNTSSPADISDADPVSSQIVHPETINGIELQPDVISALIQEYYSHYHPRFPILLDRDVFLRKYNSNKLLLWTILAIASQEMTEHAHLYQLLVDPVRQLASDLYSSVSRSFETVQALLLLCAWPFPYQRTINDPAPMYDALATQIAYQLGVHRPQFAMDFIESRNAHGYPGELTRKNVWFGCVIINYCLSSKLGVPSAIRPGHAILSEIAKGPASVIPEPLLSLMCLTHVGSKALTALGDHEYSASGAVPNCMPLVAAFESELIEAQERIKHRWTPEIEIYYHTQLLQIYSFALFGHSMTNHTSLTDASISQIYAKAVDSALKLASVSKLNSEDSKFWPGFIKYSILYSVIFNVPLANMGKHGSPQRLELIQSLRDGLILMKSFSKFEKDMWSRISSHVSYVLRKMEQADQGEHSSAVTIAGLSTAKNREFERLKRLEPPITSRMAANIMYHVVWTGKQAALKEERTHPQDDGPNDVDEKGTPRDETDGQNGLDDYLGMEAFNPFLDQYGFEGDWFNSGILDISADWQSLIDNV